ncbi:hypothetical protein D037_4821A, partial [Vibrio parahaemolyticus IDH02640]
MVELLTAIK